jgi:steroid delta-isomerase-like uncharacterized protein
MIMSTITTNKAGCARLYAAVNTGDLTRISAAIDDFFEPDVRNSMPLPVEATGAEALKQVWAMLLIGFPDIHVTVEEMIAEGDKIAVRNTVTGTQTGTFAGHPASGRSVRYGEMFVLRFADGRVTEISGVVDALTQMRQLGTIPVH